jgi:muconate cycloisomerase
MCAGDPAMLIESATLHFMHIPLRVSVTHAARAARTACDSIVLALRDASGACGYGEAVVREYVSGTLADEEDIPRQAAALVGRLLEPLRGARRTWPDAAALLAATPCRPQGLPYLCAVETAILDLACAEAGKDVYEVLCTPPVRERVRYGGVVPIVPIGQAEKWIDGFARFRFQEIKVKLGNDPVYNGALLDICRGRFGAEVDLRVDANASWTTVTLEDHLAVCARYGVHVVEQPFPAADSTALLRDARARGFSFVADEGVLDRKDVDSIVAAGAFDILNLRLSKNGGLSRVRDLAEAASAKGIRYQLGCMVGETAILSALGRIAASILPAPLYVEGSYDDIQLTENVTDKGIGFDLRGDAGILRGRGLGCTVVPERLARLTVRSVPC